MDVSHFITFFKQSIDPQILDIYKQYEKVVEAKTKCFVLPQGKTPQHKFVHGKIFEDSVRQAGSNCLADKKLIEEFQSLYPEFCKNPRNYDQYLSGMNSAGAVAWNIIHFMQRQPGLYTFGQRIPTNEHFTKLRQTVLIDFIKPTLIYEFKFTACKSQTDYEENHLVAGLIQILVYYLCLNLTPENARLGVLVFFSSLNKVVFYTSNLHKDGFCIKLLKEKLMENKPLEDHDPEIMPPLEVAIKDTDFDGMPPLEPLNSSNGINSLPNLGFLSLK